MNMVIIKLVINASFILNFLGHNVILKSVLLLLYSINNSTKHIHICKTML